MKRFQIIIAAIMFSGICAACAKDYAQTTPAALPEIKISGNDFAKNVADDSTGKITTDPTEEVVSGTPSYKGDSHGWSDEWDEFLHTRTGNLQPHHAYRVSFDYKVLSRESNAVFYTLFRRTSRATGDIGWHEWQGSPGSTGHIESTAVTGDATDFYVIIGIEFKGAISIDNVVIQDDPSINPPDIALPAPKRTWTAPANASYYVDSLHGSDTNDGHSAKDAWRSLDRVNAGTFAPGDHIFLRSNSIWHDYLAPAGSGSAAAPIVISSYGQGAKPALDAGGKYLTTLLIQNSQYVTVRQLDISNKGRIPQPHLTGISVLAHDCGVRHGIVLDGLSVHDVTGSDVKAEGAGSGINCTCGGDNVLTSFDGLTIQNCDIRHTDRDGIIMGGNWERTHWFPSRHVVIRNNHLADIGGDGIVPLGCDGAVVEHNVLAGGRERAQDYAAGIWPWSCDNTVIQFNEVSGMKGIRDAEGYDSDDNCRNTLFQYNYSHDNDGGFMLVCRGTDNPTLNLGNIGTVIRYNVSVDDGLHTFHFSGRVDNTAVYNNTIYIDAAKAPKIVAGDSDGGWASDTRFANNIFYVTGGKVAFDFGSMTGNTFAHNAFYGSIDPEPRDAALISADPKLSQPGLVKPSAYQLLPGSPCLSRGTVISDNGGYDFSGNPVPANKPPAIGAFQKPRTE